MNDIRRRDYEEWWKKTENVNRLLLASFEKDMAGLSDAVRKRHGECEGFHHRVFS